MCFKSIEIWYSRAFTRLLEISDGFLRYSKNVCFWRFVRVGSTSMWRGWGVVGVWWGGEGEGGTHLRCISYLVSYSELGGRGAFRLLTSLLCKLLESLSIGNMALIANFRIDPRWMSQNLNDDKTLVLVTSLNHANFNLNYDLFWLSQFDVS